MMNWIKTDDGLEATINGWVYLIEKVGATYSIWTEGERIGSEFTQLNGAKLVAETDAAQRARLDAPTQPKQGVHIDAIAGQQLIDILKRSFTTAQIKDFIDASPFDEPDTGAPEAGA